MTGASAGIGRAYALALAGAGAEVVALARRESALAEVVQAGRGLRGRIVPVPCDVTDGAAVAEAIGHPAPAFDVMVNNVGAYPSIPALAIGDAEWDGQMAVNLKAAWNAIRAVLPAMAAAGRGSIVNITAAAAAPGFAKGHAGHEGLMLYAVAKAGLNRMTTWLAEELAADGIAVNALSPGVVMSRVSSAADMPAELAGRAKPADPEVLGPPLLHLAAQTPAGITGAILHSDEFGRSWP